MQINKRRQECLASRRSLNAIYHWGNRREGNGLTNGVRSFAWDWLFRTWRVYFSSHSFTVNCTRFFFVFFLHVSLVAPPLTENISAAREVLWTVAHNRGPCKWISMEMRRLENLGMPKHLRYETGDAEIHLLQSDAVPVCLFAVRRSRAAHVFPLCSRLTLKLGHGKLAWCKLNPAFFMFANWIILTGFEVKENILMSQPISCISTFSFCRQSSRMPGNV